MALTGEQIYKMRLARKRNAEINRLIDQKFSKSLFTDKDFLKKEGKEDSKKLTRYQAHKKASEVFELFNRGGLREADEAAKALIEELESI